jgi:hypothetical protein
MRSSHNPRFTTRLSAVATDAVILARRDWKRMKHESFHLTAAEEIALVRRQDEEKRRALEEMETHRRTILESEARTQALRKTAATAQQMHDREIALEIAEAKANEDLDEVKAMNTEVMAARARTLRDAQLAQRRVLADLEREGEAADARMLEDGRLRAVEIYSERERALKTQRFAGRDVLLAQIAEHRKAAEQERALRAREKAAMEAANAARVEEDRRLEEERRTRQREFLSDCIAANDVTFRRKVRDREREIEEAQAMVEYQNEQAARAEQREREIAAAKSQKQREIAEIRKRQQKMIDTQAEVDELRARRVQEEKERQERQKELDAARRHEALVGEMRADRVEAETVKQRRLLEMARLEKREFDTALRALEAAREKARKEYEERQTAADAYRRELKADLDARAEDRRMAPLRKLDESRHLQELNQDYLDRLERIRQMKLETLASEGVPERYLTDLRNKRFVLQ